jgi:two-component system nitrogen regulation response regulator NtrX
MAKILVIDDEENTRTSLKSALDRRGHSVVTGGSFAEGARMAGAGFEIIFLDVMLPDGNGLELLKDILTRDPGQIVIIISGHAGIEMAVEAIKSGAYDFIEKPFSLDRVLVTLDNAARKKQLVDETSRLSSILYGELIGESELIKKLKADIARSAPKTSRFLILGENGTGKELAAYMIHRHSRYANGPFIPVNCAALPHELVEAELFGHTTGAFTGASKSRKGRFIEAEGGSIFLDEISEMPRAAQAKILRVLEDSKITAVGSDKFKEVTCNFIAASNKNLADMVADGKFREDLLFRINVVQYTMPPLRDRKNDIPILADYFLRRFAHETGGKEKELAIRAIGILKDYQYPGNVRELKNLMERVNIYCDGPTIKAADIKSIIPPSSRSESVSLREAVSDFERRRIESALADSRGNISETARRLGLERSHLYKKMKKLGLK